MISYQGEKTKLRPICKSDLEKSIIWRNTPDIRENVLGYRFPVTQKMEELWYESALNDQSGTRVIFAIEELENNILIGFIHLSQIDWISRRSDFGIVIGEKDFWGKGMATDSMKIIFKYAFECLNLRKICLEVVAFNNNAIRLYQKFGFEKEGRLKEHVYLENNYYDIVLMGLFNTKFREKYKTE